MRVTRSIRTALAWMALAIGVGASTVAGAAELWDPFIGEYFGEAISDTRGGAISRRDLEVKITRIRNGFNVAWVAVTRRADGRVKRKAYTIDFRPTTRERVFESAMRKDLFGNRVPHNPMRGDPYVWARIEGDTLSVFAMLVTDRGGYEMQVYHRTLIETGLDVHYTRLTEGEVKRTVQGKLGRK